MLMGSVGSEAMVVFDDCGSILRLVTTTVVVVVPVASDVSLACLMVPLSCATAFLCDGTHIHDHCNRCGSQGDAVAIIISSMAQRTNL
jgi:hypothetical protein